MKRKVACHKPSILPGKRVLCNQRGKALVTSDDITQVTCIKCRELNRRGKQ
jgi:hypothetical protein